MQARQQRADNGAWPGSADGFAFARRVLIATIVVVAVAGVLALIWYAADLLLLVFAGVLVSIPLRRLSNRLARATNLGGGVALAIVTVGLVAVVAAVGLLAAERIGSQADAFVSQLRSAFDTLRTRVEGNAWLQDVVDRLPNFSELLLGSGGALSRLGGIASSTLGGLINAAIVVIVGVYVASQPALYANGLKRLLPLASRERAGEVLATLDRSLGRWLVGRLVLMVINGGLTALALWALGVPLAFTLGVIAGVLNFIPNFGPFIAAVPAVLIALTVSPMLAVYTALGYLAVQMVDAYVLTPLIDRESVELPPVVTILAQLLLGILFGFVGLLVASPLTASVMILVKMLYVEDVLGDRVTAEPSRAVPAGAAGGP